MDGMDWDAPADDLTRLTLTADQLSMLFGAVRECMAELDAEELATRTGHSLAEWESLRAALREVRQRRREA